MYNFSQFITISCLVSFDPGAQNIQCWLGAIYRWTEHSKWSQPIKCQLHRFYSLLPCPYIGIPDCETNHFRPFLKISLRDWKILLNFYLCAFEILTQDKANCLLHTRKTLFVNGNVFLRVTKYFLGRCISYTWTWLTIRTCIETRKTLLHPHNSYPNFVSRNRDIYNVMQKDIRNSDVLKEEGLISRICSLSLASQLQDLFML